MIRSFADDTTADIWAEKNTKAARRIPRALWPVAHRKLTTLDAAQRLEDVAHIPANRFKRLRELGRYSLRVNDQYRITFLWDGQNAYDVRCEDYH